MGHGRVGGNQRSFRRQQVKIADRTCEELIVGHLEGLVSLRLCFGQRLPVFERGTVNRQGLLGFLERRQHHGVEAGRARQTASGNVRQSILNLKSLKKSSLHDGGVDRDSWRQGEGDGCLRRDFEKAFGLLGAERF